MRGVATRGDVMFLTCYPLGKFPIDKGEIGINIATMAGESRWLLERAPKPGSLLQRVPTRQEERKIGG
jgi:hypothetical protein